MDENTNTGRMPKLTMEIEPIEEVEEKPIEEKQYLAEDTYVEKPIMIIKKKEKRPLSDKQKSHLEKIRVLSVEKRKKVKKEKPTENIEEQIEEKIAPQRAPQRDESVFDMDALADKVYGRIKAEKERKDEEEEDERQYEKSIREDERNRIRQEFEKRKPSPYKNINTTSLLTPQPNWEECFNVNRRPY